MHRQVLAGLLLGHEVMGVLGGIEKKLWRGARSLAGPVWSTWALRAADQTGAGADVEGLPLVRNRGELRIGRALRIISRPSRVLLEVFAAGGRLIIGDRVFLNWGVALSATRLIQIGDDVLIGPNCSLFDNNFHGVDRREVEPEPAPIILEDGVWLARGVIVLPGVTIGRGTVVAAGAVVTRSLPAGVLAAGVPARVVRKLNGVRRALVGM